MTVASLRSAAGAALTAPAICTSVAGTCPASWPAVMSENSRPEVCNDIEGMGVPEREVANKVGVLPGTGEGLFQIGNDVVRVLQAD